MFGKAHVRLLPALAVFGLVVCNANAGIIYNNYGPADSYDPTTAWVVDYAGTGYNPSMPFTAAITAALGEIYLNVGNDLGTSSLDITLRADSNGTPGTVIEEFDDITGLPDLNGVSFPPLTLQSALQPILQAGQQYWLSATANDPGGQFGWWFNSTGDVGEVSVEINGVPGIVSDTRGVFELTSAAPEPSSLILAFIGVLAVALWRSVIAVS